MAETHVEFLELQTCREEETFVELSPLERKEIVTTMAEIRLAGHTLKEVWERFQAIPKETERVTHEIQRVVTELILIKRGANRRSGYLTTLENALKSFIRGRETLSIDKWTTSDVSNFATQANAMSSQKSLVYRCRSLFSYAMRRGYIDKNPCDGLEPITLERHTPQILTMEQARAAIGWAVAHAIRFVPWLVLGIFAGLRPEEADNITWENVGPTWIRIDAASTKVRQRRIVNLEPVTVRWLEWCKKKGLSLPIGRTTRRRDQRDLRGVLGLKEWPKDVLRHTAATYLLLLHQDAPKVALMLGNSPGVLLTHYRGMVTNPDPSEFWGMGPDVILNSPLKIDP